MNPNVPSTTSSPGPPATPAAGWMRSASKGLLRVGESVLGSRGFLIFEVAFLAALSALLAFKIGPLPHSDWEYYWVAAGDVRAYERGGLGLWLLALPKAVGLSPVAAALLINIPAAALVLWFVRAVDPLPAKLFALLAAFYLLLLTPYAGIVQLDMVAAASLGAGFFLVFRQPAGTTAARRIVAAAIPFAIGVSTKPQYALIAWALIGLLVIPWSLARRRGHVTALSTLLAALLLGSLAGFAFDMGLRALSGRSEAIRTTSAVTLYGGLLTSSTNVGCGYWSVAAAEAAKADLDKPLHTAVLDRLSAKSPEHWAAVMQCKWGYIYPPGAFAMYWLVESPNVRARLNASPSRASLESNYQSALRAEGLGYAAATRAILFTVFAVFLWLMWKRAPLLALLPLAWVLAFWGVHLVFEVQGRYFLGLYLLAPLLCALVVRSATPTFTGLADKPEGNRFTPASDEQQRGPPEQ